MPAAIECIINRWSSHCHVIRRKGILGPGSAAGRASGVEGRTAPVLLSDELLTLPDLVRDLTEAQQRTEQRLEELAQAQQRTEKRLDILVEEVQALVKAQHEMVLAIKPLAEDQASMKEILLEKQYREKAGSYFGRILKKVKVVPVISLEDQLEAKISETEFLELLEVDLVVSGVPRHSPQNPTVWLAVEVSSVVDKSDVRRARERAAILRKAGLNALPVVAGEAVTTGAENEAREFHITLFRDGQVQFWQEALQDLPQV